MLPRRDPEIRGGGRGEGVGRARGGDGAAGRGCGGDSVRGDARGRGRRVDDGEIRRSDRQGVGGRSEGRGGVRGREVAPGELQRARERARDERVAEEHARSGVFRHLRVESGRDERRDHGVHVRGKAQEGRVRVRLPDRRFAGDHRRARPRRPKVRREDGAAVARGGGGRGRRPRRRRATEERESRESAKGGREQRVRVGHREQAPPRGRQGGEESARGRRPHGEDAAVRVVRALTPGHRRDRAAASGGARDSPPRREGLGRGRGRRPERLQHLHSDDVRPVAGAAGEAHHPHLRRGERAVREVGGDGSKIFGIRGGEARRGERSLRRPGEGHPGRSRPRRGGDDRDAAYAAAVRSKAPRDVRSGRGHDADEFVRRGFGSGTGDRDRGPVGGGGLDVPGDRRSGRGGERVLHRELARERVEEPRSAVRTEDWEERVTAFG
mmetsp:Transcript_14984/g.53969  ORF Transcript_14984/g.53969 Transcript_14984/m.53969 type:complete len:440 (-) Transcript_14984:3268-4587(-)